MRQFTLLIGQNYNTNGIRNPFSEAGIVVV